MKYREARQLFEQYGGIVPHGWHYCSFHKDIESDAEPCPGAIRSGEATPLGAMKWKETGAAKL
jgi:hypothetical protein